MKIVAFLLVVTSWLAPRYASAQVDSSREVVVRYLDGLKNLDQDRMNLYLAPSAITRSRDGEEHPLDRASMKNMRGFEKAVNTRWSYKIVGVSGDKVSVELIEANEFYDSLGLGDRTQQANYFVRDGLIYCLEGGTYSHPTGDYASQYAAFKKWLSTTPAAHDRRIMRPDGAIIFDAESAQLLQPWLVRWSKTKAWRQP